MHRKSGIFLLFIIAVTNVLSQIAFEDDFNSYALDFDLLSQDYEMSQKVDYTGTVTAFVASSDANKYAKLVAQPNGNAQMLFKRIITVTPGVAYTFEVLTKGEFKRDLRILNATTDQAILKSKDFIPSASEKTEWVKLNLNFVPNNGVNQVKIAVFHNWSGTLSLDDITVRKIESHGAYYLSSSEGNDSNDGTQRSPWQSLNKISNTSLLPGDSVLFKSDDEFTGHFIVNGSGSEAEPIFVSSYGEGAKPIISGKVGSEGGGDYQEAILVENNDNLLFDGLDVRNERIVPRNGVSDEDAYGMLVENNGNRVLRNITLRNMTFQDVYAVKPVLTQEDFNGLEVAGLRFFTKQNNASKQVHIKDVLIENCYFTDIQRLGIHFKHGNATIGVGNDSINRNMNLVVRNNEFYYLGGTSVLPQRTYNCLIENNIFDHPGATIDPRMPGRGSSVWNFHSINTVIQYNECLSTRGYFDSHGIHIDHRNKNTFIQYNYMEDCEGGFVEILKGNLNSVYRFNVSVNDGWRSHPTWKNSNHTIWINAGRETDDMELPDSSFVYNNTVLVNKGFTTAIEIDAKNTFIYNNIFSSINGSKIGKQNVAVRDNASPLNMTNNLFQGSVDNRFVALDTDKTLGDPKFIGTGENQNKYQIKEGSAAINNGVLLPGPVVKNAGLGIFKDIEAYPSVDFYGNPLDLFSGKPNIGACNAYNTGIGSNIDNPHGYKKNDLLVFPNPSQSIIRLKFASGIHDKMKVKLINLKGKVLLNNVLNQDLTKNYTMKLESEIPNGIYTINVSGNDKEYNRRIVLIRK